MSGANDARPRPPAAGPSIRTDVLDVYIFRRVGVRREVELLQLKRAGEPLRGTWQPVMGHIEPGETAVAGMWRELREETGLAPGDERLLGAWALEGVHPFLVARLDTIFMSPRFAVEAQGDWTPRLCAEHTQWRWVALAQVREQFMWPGQIASIGELVERVLAPGSTCEQTLRLSLPRAAPDPRRT